ncbi:hypothetical protein U1Q18_003245, partial [Sarracenia purpurea var. burkii]
MLAAKPRRRFSLPNQLWNHHSSAPDFPSPFSALPPRPSLAQTQQVHARLITAGLAADAQLVGHLIAALALSPSTPSEYSRSIFKSIRNPTVFAANNAMRCFAKSEFPLESVVLYAFMRRSFVVPPNNYTFPFVLQACGKALALVEGNQIHADVVKLGFGDDVYIRNALIHLYSACRKIGLSKEVFDESPWCRDVVSWNVLLGGY